MWKKVSKFSNAGISVTSYKSERTSLRGPYRIAIFFSSFEPRCLTCSTLLPKGSVQESIIVFFKEKDPVGLRHKHDKIILRNVIKATKGRTVKMKAISTSKMEEGITSLLCRIVRSKLYPNDKILIDTSGAPMPFFLSILSYLRRLSSPPNIHLFHPTGEYPKPKAKRNYVFHTGHDRYMWTPWLWGQQDPSRKTTFVFLLGFEGNRALTVRSRFQPDTCFAVIGSPGYTSRYQRIAREKNKEFLKGVPQSNVILAHAADVPKAWKTLQFNLGKLSETTNLCIVPLGTKSHGISAALFALSLVTPSIMYVLPKKFECIATKRGKMLWLYDIKV